MDTDLLKKLGLNSNEIRVYLSLLKLGQTSTGKLIKESRVPSSKIYISLENLISKGLASYIMKGKVRLFRPSNPSVLLSLVETMQKEVNELKEKLNSEMPTFMKRFEQDKPAYNAEIFEGLRGIKEFYDLSLNILERGEWMYTLGYPPMASELLNAYFVDFHKKKDRKGVCSKVLFDYDTWFMKKREKRRYALQRYLPRGMHTPAFVHIFRNYIGIMVITEDQKTCIVIKNKEVADSYREYFELLWKIAKEP
jgi:sugar-specific transcriptional regulator TrmB